MAAQNMPAAEIDIDGSRSEALVEPLTTYGVVRGLKEFGDGGSGLGFIGTSVFRDLAGSPLESILPRNPSAYDPFVNPGGLAAAARQAAARPAVAEALRSSGLTRERAGQGIEAAIAGARGGRPASRAPLHPPLRGQLPFSSSQAIRRLVASESIVPRPTWSGKPGSASAAAISSMALPAARPLPA